MRPIFDFEGYEIALTFLGISMLLAAWLPKRFSSYHTTLPFIHLLFGFLVFQFIDVEPLNPFVESDRWAWEKLTEFAVILSLLGAGVKIDRDLSWKNWRPTVYLILLTMPITILAVSLWGWAVCGIPVATAALLGAVLAPTDPVLASEIQVGPPNTGKESDLRFALTSEAGLNDSLAFPFTYLAIFLATKSQGDWKVWGLEWVGVAIIYKLIIGLLAGVAIGYLLSQLLFKSSVSQSLARKGMGFIVFSLLFLSYGATELLGGYGFLAVFIAALKLRKMATEHKFHAILHDFGENLERGGMAIILFLLGGLFTILYPYLDIRSLGVMVALLLVIRPVATVIGLSKVKLERRDKLGIAMLGIRGIGSLYYLAYACGKHQFEQDKWLWATVTAIIIISAIAHGIGAPILIKRLERS